MLVWVLRFFGDHYQSDQGGDAAKKISRIGLSAAKDGLRLTGSTADRRSSWTAIRDMREGRAWFAAAVPPRVAGSTDSSIIIDTSFHPSARLTGCGNISDAGLHNPSRYACNFRGHHFQTSAQLMGHRLPEEDYSMTHLLPEDKYFVGGAQAPKRGLFHEEAAP